MSNTKKPVTRRDREEEDRKLISEVLKDMKEKLQGADFKPSISEFIRLLQFEREMAEEVTPREIKVSWCETTTKPVTGK